MKILLVLVGVVLSYALIGLAASTEVSHFRIPDSAQIIIKATVIDKKDKTSKACADFHLNEKDVREIFESYHLLNQSQLHDQYLWAPCYVDGIIKFKNKTYTWRARAGNTLETNFPDEKPVILGGKPTDSASGP